MSQTILFYWRVKNGFIFPAWGNKTHFMRSRKSICWLSSGKRVIRNTGETFILLVWFLPSFCSGIKLYTRKINFFLPRCIIYYYNQNMKNMETTSKSEIVFSNKFYKFAFTHFLFLFLKYTWKYKISFLTKICKI